MTIQTASQPPSQGGLSQGADLRSLRKARGLTLADVAARLGKSVGWLSQVERDLSNLEADELTALAKIFGVPVSLFAAPNAKSAEQGRIVRANARRAIGERTPGLVEALLSPDLTDTFEMIHSTFQPGSSRPKPVNRPTVELALLIEGALDIWLGPDKFTLATGDTFRVRGEPLRWANPYDTPAIAVWVISPPVY